MPPATSLRGSRGEVTQKKFNQKTLQIMTYELFDSSNTCFECSIGHSDPEFVVTEIGGNL